MPNKTNKKDKPKKKPVKKLPPSALGTGTASKAAKKMKSREQAMKEAISGLRSKKKK